MVYVKYAKKGAGVFKNAVIALLVLLVLAGIAFSRIVFKTGKYAFIHKAEADALTGGGGGYDTSSKTFCSSDDAY